MQTSTATQSALLCDRCGGQCAFDPAQDTLLCQSCGTHHKIEIDADHRAEDEFPFDPDTPQEEPPQLRGDQVHQCDTCGGQVTFTGAALSEHCPYCNGPVVLQTEGSAYEAMALVPFSVTRDYARKYTMDWVRRRIAAPKDLTARAKAGRLSGVYVPFWTFDSREAIAYWASYTTGSGKHRRRRKTRGSFSVFFDDLLVPASQHVTPLIRDGVLHDFVPERLRPYRAEYLAGFAAERHHMTVAAGLDANAADKDLIIRNKIKEAVNKPGTKITRYKTDTTGIHYRRILLPVWILHYDYDGHAKKIVVSGIDGRTFGERPFSTIKLVAYSGLLTVLTVVFGAAWGAWAAL